MWMCRQVAKALADQDYEEMTPFRKASLKLHVRLCTMCGRFHRQVMDMQDGVRGFRDHEDAGDIERDVRLNPDCKCRMEQAVAELSSSKEA